MRKRMLLVGGALLAVSVATPALATPVSVNHDGPCYNATVGSKQVLPNPICYLGPPPPQ